MFKGQLSTIPRRVLQNGRVFGDLCAGVVVGFRRPGQKQASLLGPERARSSKVTGIVQASDLLKGLLNIWSKKRVAWLILR